MDLENLVNQSFEHERDLPFDEGNWEDLDRQLYKERRRKWWFGWWPWLSLLLLLVLLGNWYVQSQTINGLEARIHELTAFQPTVRTLIDTVWQTDTVYQQVRVPVFLAENTTPSSPSLPAESTGRSPIAKGADILQAKNVSPFAQATKQPAADFLSTMPIVLLHKTRTPHLALVPLNTRLEEGENRKKTLNELGITYHFGPVKDPANVAETGVIQQQFQQAGIQLRRRLWKGLGLQVELGHEWQNYQAMDSVPAYYNLQPPDLYYGNGFSSHQQNIYYRLGLDWQFLNQKRIHPMLAVGVMGQASLINEIKATYTSDFVYLDPEIIQQTTYRKDALSLNYGYASAGIRANLFPRWGIQLSGTYLQRLKALQEYEKSFSLEAQLFYKF